MDDVGEPIVQLGEVWKLDNHRLMCGDATVDLDVQKLMDKNKADLVLTDPPYGISVVHKDGAMGGETWVGVSKHEPVIGDDSTDTAKLNYNLVKEISKNQIIFGGNYFTDFLPPSSCWIIWDKENGKSDFADVEMAWTSFKRGARLHKWLWHGCRRKGVRSLELKNRVHPTQKPVGLIKNILEDFSGDGDTILDPFLGSGSFLIACAECNRICYGMELSPKYCDVIINRWEEYSGGTAVRLGN